MFLWIGEEYCKKTERTEQNFPTILPDSVEKEKKNDTLYIEGKLTQNQAENKKGIVHMWILSYFKIDIDLT